MALSFSKKMDRYGLLGLFLTAFLSPCCFPLFAFAASAFGLGSFELFGGWTMWIFQAMVLVVIGGLIPSYLRHRCWYPLAIAIPSGTIIFYSYHFMESPNWIYLMYVGMIGLLVSVLVNYHRNKLHGNCDTCTVINGVKVELESIITCPYCKHQSKEIMPTDACCYFYDCKGCKQQIKPTQGDCCVYCSYGTVNCPPVQQGQDCC